MIPQKDGTPPGVERPDFVPCLYCDTPTRQVVCPKCRAGRGMTLAEALAHTPPARLPGQIVNLGDYRERRKRGETPAEALKAVREGFQVGDLVRDREGGSLRKVVAVESFVDEDEGREVCCLGLEGEYEGRPMYDGIYFVVVERGAA
jgi:hypothetical protein